MFKNQRYLVFVLDILIQLVHNSGLIGDRSADKPANLIPIICEVASGKRKKLIINGMIITQKMALV